MRTTRIARTLRTAKKAMGALCAGIAVIAWAGLASRAAAQEAPTPAPMRLSERAPRAEAPEAPTPLPALRPGKSAMFQIALVLADSEPAQGAPQALPKGLQKALNDIQDFLPFKSYRLFDSALVRGTGHGQASLKGPDGGEYDAQFSFRDDGDARSGILVDEFGLVKKPALLSQPLPRGVAPRAPETPQMSSFRIRRGETVVVGSSGLPGGKSLIVVVTALPD
jgi:hypothetical protein